jgi:uncharacterized membrane protein SpoIIM required for sporulation
MNRDWFVARRRERWQRLDDLVARVEHRGLRALNAEELLELGSLYRSATSDLAVARRDFGSDRVALYLNGLVARTHPIVYREQRGGSARVGEWVRYGFPAAYRAIGPYTAFAFGVFTLSAFVAWLLVAWRDSMADILLPGTAQQLRHIMDQHHLWMNNPGESDSVVANFIMLNNIQVAFLAFAGGMLLGVLTTYVMVTNGVMLGALGAMVAHRGLSAPFWSFVVPHGVVELSVIFMAGGAGLSLGDALLRPGMRTRRDALVRAGRQAAYVVLAAVPLLAVAGTIEGFLSPSGAPVAIKIAVGLLTGTGLYSYLLLSRPRQIREPYRLNDLLAPRQAPAHSDPLPLTSR